MQDSKRILYRQEGTKEENLPEAGTKDFLRFQLRFPFWKKNVGTPTRPGFHREVFDGKCRNSYRIQ
ncbi:hypothetical protein CH380_16260 [Leptospira adleri]|uniref:Uncharacterized protein n=1 Tax=Leptospira adleri TaxID=2023186 RepID=A0A2M9YL44_9LEPT|nr:hypothetical protein CH380_16260 [Leptospira adleri]PJZ63197.1 hypothetical protein CH376_03980 [Leptospira adleri]